MGVMELPKRQSPFALLGQKLRQFRETRRESLAEVSGAVEIDTDLLERIERGEECPSEDILTLLINHFALREHEAVELWEWAGFQRAAPDTAGLQEMMSKATVVLMALDARVLYSDHADIATSEHGLVMTFTQSSPQSQQVPIARVGMSYEHAQKVLETLQTALLRQKYQLPYKLLPPGDTTK